MDLTDAPKISVVLSVYNGEKYLQDALDSLLEQTIDGFEIVLIDDASTDGTADIVTNFSRSLRELDKNYSFKNLRNKSNLGLTKSLNIGLLIATGEYVARLDADDINYPTRLALQANYLDSHPDITLVACRSIFFDGDGKYLRKDNCPINSSYLAWLMLFYCPFSHSAVMFRRQYVINEYGAYNEKFEYSQDYELWSRICLKDKIGIVPDYLVNVREVNQSMTNMMGELVEEEPVTISSTSMQWYMSSEKYVLDNDQIINLKNLWLENKLSNVVNMQENLTIYKKLLNAFVTQLDNTDKENVMFKKYLSYVAANKLKKQFLLNNESNVRATLSSLKEYSRIFGIPSAVSVLLRIFTKNKTIFQ